jgi:hypothetical protein
MVRDPIRRIAKYSAKIDYDSIAQRYTSVKPLMTEQVSNIYGEIVDVEAKVKATLEGATPAVKITEIPGYLSYSRELWSSLRRHTGNIGIAEAQAIKDKWKARGLKDTVLKEIASNVFGITLS